MDRAALRSLSIVLPVYNGAAWIEPTAARLAEAVAAAGLSDVELVVVDDGSTDDTAAVVESLALPIPVRLVRQENKGRFLARRAGIDAATSDFVLLIDVRVFIAADALANVDAQLHEHPERRVWNAHVDIAVKGNPFARFWQAVTFAAWRRYLARPRLVSFTDEDFDYYPKGTTCFLAPRQRLLDAYGQFHTYYDDLRRVNDDTSLIRHIAAAEPVWLGPEFACTYHARDNLRSFLKHAYHRGFPFVDGYFRRGSRYLWFIIAFLVATPVGLVALALWPLAVLAVGVVGLAGVAALMLAIGTPPAAVASFTLLVPVFALAYGAGIWSAVALAVASRLRGPKH